ncbi:DVU3141 family protein [Halomonas stenophila]|uniref:Common-antigen outer membrane protein n=1 Tax=Halomonas stenophila TaxID=795312 RepID=A0A7W5ERW2_9GAMM|nr:DVU3141 family protein [Halomonas stenophila]MBB3230151.1 hypothetical protein [Halomonas stenophila]
MPTIAHLLLSRPARCGLAVMGCSLLLSGCAALGGFPGSKPGGVVDGGQGQTLDENLSGFLAQAPVGAVITLAESPWGRDVEVMADEPYHAASGRECRKLQVISASDATRRVVACETEEGWESQRLVTDMLSAGSTR